MSTPFKECKKGEVIASLSMVSPFFLINHANAESGIVITHGRRTEFMCICNDKLECHDIAEVSPISQKESHFLELIRNTGHELIFVTDIWWLTDSALNELINLRNKKVCVFVQYPNQIAFIEARLAGLCVGPCDLANSNHATFEFAGRNLQKISLPLQYSVNEFANFKWVKSSGEVIAIDVALGVNQEAMS